LGIVVSICTMQGIWYDVGFESGSSRVLG
jgi:hypothetical protein